MFSVVPLISNLAHNPDQFLRRWGAAVTVALFIKLFRTEKSNHPRFIVSIEVKNNFTTSTKVQRLDFCDIIHLD